MYFCTVYLFVCSWKNGYIHERLVGTAGDVQIIALTVIADDIAAIGIHTEFSMFNFDRRDTSQELCLHSRC